MAQNALTAESQLGPAAAWMDPILALVDRAEYGEQSDSDPVAGPLELAGKSDKAPVVFVWLVVGIALTCNYNMCLSWLWRYAVAVAASLLLLLANPTGR